MSIRWEGDLRAGLKSFQTGVHLHVVEELADATETTVLADATARVPKESGHLAESGKVDKGRGGANTVGVSFAGPYARWVHEHLAFKHPHGGEAKFLETALLTKGGDAIRRAGERLWRVRG